MSHYDAPDDSGLNSLHPPDNALFYTDGNDISPQDLFNMLCNMPTHAFHPGIPYDVQIIQTDSLPDPPNDRYQFRSSSSLDDLFDSMYTAPTCGGLTDGLTDSMSLAPHTHTLSHVNFAFDSQGSASSSHSVGLGMATQELPGSLYDAEVSSINDLEFLYNLERSFTNTGSM